MLQYSYISHFFRWLELLKNWQKNEYLVKISIIFSHEFQILNVFLYKFKFYTFIYQPLFTIMQLSTYKNTNILFLQLFFTSVHMSSNNILFLQQLRTRILKNKKMWNMNMLIVCYNVVLDPRLWTLNSRAELLCFIDKTKP
jgi:hypothetical protein